MVQLNKTNVKMNLKNSKKLLMIVEDNEDLQQYYRHSFLKTQWKIIIQERNGLEAQKRYQDQFPKPSVIILDVELPGASGYSVAEYILRQNPLQIILFVSGNTDFKDERSIPASLRSVPRISKPFKFKELLLILNNLISDR
ncbi:MAG: response regulator [Candidatus Hodarchaeales archaeon]|jgi:DNA-binding response OmpR family regulator